MSVRGQGAAEPRTLEPAVAEAIIPNRTVRMLDVNGVAYRIPCVDDDYVAPGQGSNVVTLDFGATPTPEGQVDVAFSAGPLGMRVRAWFSGRSTNDNTVLDHVMAQALMKLSIGNYVTGGFTIFANSIGGLVTGTFRVNWAWI